MGHLLFSVEKGVSTERSLLSKLSIQSIAIVVTAIVAVILIAMPASASVVIDYSNGTGFIGKGDVQLVYGWNNNQLQTNASNVKFQVKTEVVTEVSWVCTNDRNENIQERERTTTTKTQGVLNSSTRDKRNQVTGFTLLGYVSDPSVSITTSGQILNSCPGGPWSLTVPAGDPVELSRTGGVQVSNDSGTTWVNLQ